jgi:outer membrane protein assembly factor BamE (lipoprotein component of BamABCDE complex)
MTRNQLLFTFGRPLRVQQRPNGGEEWFYHFGSQQHESHPFSESSVSETERSYSTGHTTSTTTTMNQAPSFSHRAAALLARSPQDIL